MGGKALSIEPPAPSPDPAPEVRYVYVDRPRAPIITARGLAVGVSLAFMMTALGTTILTGFAYDAYQTAMMDWVEDPSDDFDDVPQDGPFLRWGPTIYRACMTIGLTVGVLGLYIAPPEK